MRRSPSSSRMLRLCRNHLSIILLFLTVSASAQMEDPVHFTSQLRTLSDNEAEVVFTATIEPGWHVYSTDLGEGGPTEATFHADRLEGVELVGRLKPRGSVVSNYDPMFGMELKYFENTATFVQRLRFTRPHYVIECYLEYGACSDEMCIPPSQVELRQEGDVQLAAAPDHQTEIAEEPVTPEDQLATVPDELSSDSPLPSDSSASQAPLVSDSALWAPVIDELQAFGSEGDAPTTNSSLWFIFPSGLLGGFLAILTPCVWPIIPLTVSFFLKRNKQRRQAVREAIAYGLSIVVIYVALGLLVTLLFGASALNALSTNALFNIFFALLLIVFAASFFGAFELTLPSSWSNKVDQKVDDLQSSSRSSKSSASSLLSIFLMAFTLALVSFSCTGPIIGFLLVAVSTQGEIVGPAVGMLGFAIALAIPFTLFALFPSWLKQMPKSGGWMNTVKVVLGFIELAFALKFLSVADLAYGWHLLDREVFLSLWIVLFTLLGAYLLGWLKFSHDDPEHKTNVPQFFLALVSLAFAVYMVPGLWGAPLKAISAFSPPMNTQDFNLYSGSVEARFTDYDQAIAAARAEGKPVMVDFTGFGCVNCRKMETKVWTDPTVRQLLNDDYLLVSLYVDDKTPLPGGPVDVTENGQTRRLRTIGDRWSYLQRTKVGQNTQPCYLLLDPVSGKPLGPLRSYDEDIAAYIDYLRKGLARFR